MVTIRSSIASCKRAFQATGSRQLLAMTLFLPILCTLICVSHIALHCFLLSHVPNWQYPPFSLRVPCATFYIQKSPCRCLALSFVLSLTIEYF